MMLEDSSVHAQLASVRTQDADGYGSCRSAAGVEAAACGLAAAATSK